MNYWQSILLLGQRTGLDDLANRMSEGFRGDRVRLGSLSTWIGLASLLGIALGFWWLSRLAARQDRGVPCNDPCELFKSLCKAHRLTWRERRLLARLARWQQLEDPARLFLEPQRFDPQWLGPSLTASADRLRAVRNRLFAGMPRESRQALPPVEPAPIA